MLYIFLLISLVSATVNNSITQETPQPSTASASITDQKKQLLEKMLLVLQNYVLQISEQQSGLDEQLLTRHISNIMRVFKAMKFEQTYAVTQLLMYLNHILTLPQAKNITQPIQQLITTIIITSAEDLYQSKVDDTSGIKLPASSAAMFRVVKQIMITKLQDAASRDQNHWISKKNEIHNAVDGFVKTCKGIGLPHNIVFNEAIIIFSNLSKNDSQKEELDQLLNKFVIEHYGIQTTVIPLDTFAQEFAQKFEQWLLNQCTHEDVIHFIHSQLQKISSTIPIGNQTFDKAITHIYEKAFIIVQKNATLASILSKKIHKLGRLVSKAFRTFNAYVQKMQNAPASDSNVSNTTQEVEQKTTKPEDCGEQATLNVRAVKLEKRRQQQELEAARRKQRAARSQEEEEKAAAAAVRKQLLEAEKAAALAAQQEKKRQEDAIALKEQEKRQKIERAKSMLKDFLINQNKKQLKQNVFKKLIALVKQEQENEQEIQRYYLHKLFARFKSGASRSQKIRTHIAQSAKKKALSAWKLAYTANKQQKEIQQIPTVSLEQTTKHPGALINTYPQHNNTKQNEVPVVYLTQTNKIVGPAPKRPGRLLPIIQLLENRAAASSKKIEHKSQLMTREPAAQERSQPVPDAMPTDVVVSAMQAAQAASIRQQELEYLLQYQADCNAYLQAQVAQLKQIMVDQALQQQEADFAIEMPSEENLHCLQPQTHSVDMIELRNVYQQHHGEICNLTNDELLAWAIEHKNLVMNNQIGCPHCYQQCCQTQIGNKQVTLKPDWFYMIGMPQ